VKAILSILAGSCLALPVAAAPVKLDVRAEQKVLHHDERECVIQINLTGDEAEPDENRLPLNLALVLDRSGSMRGVKLERAKQAAAVALEQLDEEDTVSVVVYDDEVEVLVPPQPATRIERIIRRIESIQPRGRTALYGGVQKGADQLEEYLDEEQINRVLLLSDGLANVGPSSTRSLSQLGRLLAKRDIAVTTIGLGEDYNEDLMTALAEASRANYYYVSDPEELPAIFAEELRSLKAIVARKIRIIIDLPEGVSPRAVLGEPELQFEGNTLEIDLATLAARESRQFLVLCETESPEAVEIARVKVDYETREGTRNQASAKLQVERTDDAAKAEASRDREVAAEVAITQNRLAKEKAVALADEGRVEEAQATLEQQQRANAAVADSLPAPAGEMLRQENESLSATQQLLQEERRLDKATRKRIQYENYQDKFDKR